MMREQHLLQEALKNYKDTGAHQEAAKRRGVLQEFMQSKTLTQARKFAYGDAKSAKGKK